MRRTVFSICRSFSARRQFASIPLHTCLNILPSRCFFSSPLLLEKPEANTDFETEELDPVDSQATESPSDDFVVDEEFDEDGFDDLLEEHLSRIEELEEYIERLTHKYAIVVADQENTRRIARDDVDKARKFCISSFARDLLEVSDALGMAIESMRMFEDDLAGDEVLSKRLSSTLKGVQMTERILGNIFRQHGIVEVEQAPGELFDPEFQEAVVQLPTPNRELVGTVAEILKSGYLIHDRTLRACQVVVYVMEPNGGNDKEVTQETDEGEEEETEKQMLL